VRPSDLIVWVVEVTEPIPAIDHTSRRLRCSMLCNALAKCGHEIVWWNSTFDHARKKHRTTPVESTVLEPGVELRLLHGPGYRSNVSLARVRHNRILAQDLHRQLSESQRLPDIVFACWPVPEVAEVIVAWADRMQIPSVLDIRDVWPDVYLTAFPRSVWPCVRSLLCREYSRARRTTRLATALTAVSQEYLDWGLRLGRRERNKWDHVVPIGYELNRIPIADEPHPASREAIQSCCPNTQDIVFTFAGTLGTSCDLLTLVKAVAELETSGVAGFQVVIAGDGDMMSKLRRRTERLTRLTLTGWLDEVSLADLFSEACVGLALYQPMALQSLPNKPFEYWASRLPIISSLEGELAEIVRTEGVGVQYVAGDVASLKEAMLWYIKHREEAEEMGQRARRLVEQRFDAEVIYGRIAENLEMLVTEWKEDRP
jgi:glycosyltransferase involved in cell wall biosynthesis